MLIPPSAMSLPVITSLEDCASYSKTVEPYLQALWQNPRAFLPADLTSVEAWQHTYISTNPLASALLFTISTFPLFLLISEINKNYSQVDRVWSILPTVFNAHFAIWARMNGLPSQKLDHVLAFSVLWSSRLTFNYWRKGGYSVGSEDYRWKIIQDRVGGVAFFLLNVLFISSAQILILLAVTTPTYILLLTSRLSPRMDAYDTTISRALIALIVVEYFADQQQWNYHLAKHSYQRTAKVPPGWTRAQMDRGFLTTGLWRFSRHPNFAAEQAIWAVLYAWGCYASGTSWNWSVGGVVAYWAVFAGSTPLTEWISKGKYSEYEVYQQRVGRFVPGLWTLRGWVEEEEVVEGTGKAVEKEGKGKKKT